MSIKDTYDWYAKEGYLKANTFGGLTLYNYTTKTVLEANWNHHTMTARGLILDGDSNVIARPWPKFFSLNERPETNIARLPDETPELAEKLDGSMVVCFWNPESNKWQAVTRGSWDNIQGQYGNKWLATHGEKLDKKLTYMFELVAPWNRIVVFYPKDEMIMTGVINTLSTEDYSYAQVRAHGEGIGLKTVNFEIRPPSDIDLDDPNILNQEGYVARYSNGFRVKLKYGQYLMLHRIMTTWSLKGMWEALSQGKNVDLTGMPDAFKDWFDTNKTTMVDQVRAIETKAKRIYAERPVPPTDSTPQIRKEMASYFSKFPDVASICFRMFDNRPYIDLAWKMVKPKNAQTFFQSQGKEDE